MTDSIALSELSQVEIQDFTQPTEEGENVDDPGLDQEWLDLYCPTQSLDPLPLPLPLPLSSTAMTSPQLLTTASFRLQTTIQGVGLLPNCPKDNSPAFVTSSKSFRAHYEFIASFCQHMSNQYLVSDVVSSGFDSLRKKFDEKSER